MAIPLVTSQTFVFCIISIINLQPFEKSSIAIPLVEPSSLDSHNHTLNPTP